MIIELKSYQVLGICRKERVLVDDLLLVVSDGWGSSVSSVSSVSSISNWSSSSWSISVRQWSSISVSMSISEWSSSSSVSWGSVGSMSVGSGGVSWSSISSVSISSSGGIGWRGIGGVSVSNWSSDSLGDWSSGSVGNWGSSDGFSGHSWGSSVSVAVSSVTVGWSSSVLWGKVRFGEFGYTITLYFMSTVSTYGSGVS